MKKILRISSMQTDFVERLRDVTAVKTTRSEEIDRAVAEILEAVRRDGDAAVLHYTERFDKLKAASIRDLEIPASELKEALNGLTTELREALEIAASRIREFHNRQKAESWEYVEQNGTRLGQRVSPLERAGLYVPGGLAAYPSSVLMNALPAKIAGVDELIMVTPTPGGQRNQMVLAAAAIGGVDRVLTIGGAQAIAALAYGTESIPGVDKIVGPGNAYVASAKRQVFGKVGIDMIAGPSEILIICDGSTDPDWVAMDMLAQSEHDEMAQAILLTPDANYADLVEASLKRLILTLPRRDVATRSLESRGALIQTRDLDEACDIANQIAPEHLEISVEQPERLVNRVRNAGAIFLGRYSSESLGDYCAGPNHVLPTSRSARFSSPLGVYDFQKRSSIIDVSRTGADLLGGIATILAEGEGLAAHARSAGLRILK